MLCPSIIMFSFVIFLGYLPKFFGIIFNLCSRILYTHKPLQPQKLWFTIHMYIGQPQGYFSFSHQVSELNKLYICIQTDTIKICSFNRKISYLTQGNYATQDSSGMCHLMPQQHLRSEERRRRSGLLYTVAVQVLTMLLHLSLRLHINEVDSGWHGVV